MKVAVVHYWLITRRGGEKVLESILKLYPQADVYTLFYDETIYGNHLKNYKVYTSKYDKPFYRKYYQKLFPLFPRMINSLELKGEYDLIISSESGPAKGIKINNSATHICYIHSPMRYCWGFTNEYLKAINPLFRGLARCFFRRLRNWDKTTIDNVDLYIANSNNVANRVKKYYNRESKIIYPPINKDLFSNPLKSGIGDYFLSFGAIVPYKRVDLLVDYFNTSNEKLVVIGFGSEKEQLTKKANKNIIFKGFVEDKDLINYILNAKALLFPGEEDFGMIPLEVMALGLPVIAYNKGGALETVVENRKDINKSTGLFFKHQTKESLNEAINFFLSKESSFDPKWIRKHALNFEEQNFLTRFRKIIETNT